MAHNVKDEHTTWGEIIASVCFILFIFLLLLV
jgi:hypothetical protein